MGGFWDYLSKKNEQRTARNTKKDKLNTIEAIATTSLMTVDSIAKNLQINLGSTVLRIKIPNSSDHYHRMNYEAVQNELKVYGFTNIALLPQKDLIKGWLTKDGEVESVSINGKTTFKKGASFRVDSRIVIVFHTFKTSK